MTTGKQLSALRQKIDALDENILELLNRRAQLAIDVARTKRTEGEGDCFYRPDREAEVLRRIKEINSGPLDDEVAARLFRELMSACLALEKPLTVAFLGPEGTFTQQAAYKHFGRGIDTLALSAIDEIFRSVEGAAVRYGVVPVENSTEGVITHTLDSFLKSSLRVCGEVELRIHHNLLSKQTGLDSIKEVFSHQQSLAQCRGWLDRFLPGIRRTSVSSNAEAARLVAIMPNSAAIAGEVAAPVYDLNVLEKSIEDEPENTTRFLVVGNQAPASTGEDKTSLLLSMGNRPGALYDILEPFARYDISMTKIESRPSRRGMWDYVFFIDIEGHRDDPTVRQALASLGKTVNVLKILGSYPRAVL